MRCSYCAVPLIDAERRNEMEIHEATVAITNLKSMGVDLIVFTGGETLLRPDLLKVVIPFCQEQDIYPVLLTNGRLLAIDDERKEMVKGFEASGDFGLSFSMDYMHYAWNEGIEELSRDLILDERHKSHYGLRGLYWAMEKGFDDVTATIVMDDVEPIHAYASARHLSEMGVGVIINLVQRSENSVMFQARAHNGNPISLLETVNKIRENGHLLLRDHPKYYEMLATGYYKEWKCSDPGLVVVQPDGALSLCNSLYGHELPQHFNILENPSIEAYKAAWQEDLKNCCPGCFLNCHVNYHLRHELD